MSEPWLRGEEGAWFPSPQVQGAYNITVNELMNTNVKSWNKEKIESIFPLHITNRILNTPLFDMIEEDSLIWEDNIHGQYSVKSGYKLMSNAAGRSDVVVQQCGWERLWKIHAPPKAKHLLWRICKGCLPTRTRLQERRVLCPLSCPLCVQSNEDDWHIFFECNDSVQATAAAGLDSLITPRIQQQTRVSDVIMQVCSTANQQEAGVFAMLLWLLWNNRNNCVWNDTRESGRSLGFKARLLWEEWAAVQQVQQPTESINQQQQQQLHSWNKPPVGWYKCNVDAGFHKEVNKTSFGWCLRDHEGSIIVAGTNWKDGIYSILEGETLALLHAMKEIVQRGFSHVIFETDSMGMVNAIQHLRGGYSEFSSLICHVKNTLLLYPNFVVKFIKRQANMVAHTLARA
ncbi:ribonuclease H protein, partial [Trifolium medium]|nr:ribonuclease H protein [Trifolium medium]